MSHLILCCSYSTSLITLLFLVCQIPVSRGTDSDEDDIDKYFLQNQKQSMTNLIIDDDADDEISDLTVTVDKPEKHVTAMESYMTFRVNTQVQIRSMLYFCLRNRNMYAYCCCFCLLYASCLQLHDNVLYFCRHQDQNLLVLIFSKEGVSMISCGCGSVWSFLILR